MNGPWNRLGSVDLVTIGLIVFFVALILVVAGLLFLPNVL